MKKQRKSKERPVATVPVYYIPTDADLEALLNPSTPPTSATQKFYRSLRYPDEEIEIPIWEDDERDVIK